MGFAGDFERLRGLGGGGDFGTGEGKVGGSEFLLDFGHYKVIDELFNCGMSGNILYQSAVEDLRRI